MSKKKIASQLHRKIKDISIDLDAYSLVLTTKDMEKGVNWLRKLLLSWCGVAVTKCSLPKTATASHRKNGIFGCFEDGSQHLPRFLQGSEMLVIDTPVKLALHMSCKTRLINWLHENGYHLTAASPKTGLCFDPSFASNTFPYALIVDAILASCEVVNEKTGEGSGVFAVHVADIGFRAPLPDHPLTCTLFPNRYEAEKQGICMEMIQCDIAFVCKCDKDKLIQATCNRKTASNRKSVLQNSSLKIFPIHKVAPLKPGTLKQNDMKGTILIKKDQWEGGKEVVIENSGKGGAAGLFTTSCQLNSEENTKSKLRDKLSYHDKTTYSVKGYSTIAHPLLQRRSKFPLSWKDMFDVGKRSIESIQTLVQNANAAAKTAFSVAREHGISFRIEVSVRPNTNDPLREKGHINDILFIVWLAVRDFCDSYQPTLVLFPTRRVETDAMKLIFEARQMVMFRQSKKFEEVYANKKAVDWLRFHLSLMLITIGICPSFGVKYINTWLQDDKRFDLFNRIRADRRVDGTLSVEPTKKIARKLDISLEKILSNLKFSREAREIVTIFVRKSRENNGDYRASYVALSLDGKHLLAHFLWSDIIPNLSDLETEPNHNHMPSNGRGPEVDMHRDEEESYEGEWQPESSSISDDFIDTAPMPDHPIASSIISLIKMSSLWNPGRTGFNQVLCTFVLECHQCVCLELGPIMDEVVKQFLTQCSIGKKHLNRDDLGLICKGLGVVPSIRNVAAASYQKLLCKHYQFPSSNLSIPEGTPQKKREINRILNEVLNKDLVFTIKEDPGGAVFCRVVENKCIRIPPPSNVFKSHPGTSQSFTTKCHSANLLEVLSRAYNTSVVNLPRLFQNRWDSIMDNQFHHKFLSSQGFRKFYGRTLSTLLPTDGTFCPLFLISYTGCVYDTQMSFYDIPRRKTYFFIRHGKHPDRRCIQYQHSSLDVLPNNKKSLHIRLTKDGIYEWIEINTSHSAALQPRHCEPDSYSFSCSPVGGPISQKKCLNEAWKFRSTWRSHCHAALVATLKNLDPRYSENLRHKQHQDDSLGLRSFMDELESCHPYLKKFTGFDATVVEQCSLLGMSIRMLTQMLNRGEWEKFGYKILCPIACLKFSNLTIGVVDLEPKKKSTYFYAYDPCLRRVVCRACEGYCVLGNRPQTLYLYTSAQRASAHKKQYKCNAPEDNIGEQKKENGWRHIDSINGAYFPLGIDGYRTYLGIFKQVYNMTDLVLNTNNVKDHEFRPERPNNLLAPTHIVGGSFDMRYLSQLGSIHNALILIFRGNVAGVEWDACIVHHPLQDPSCGLHTLQDFISGAPKRGIYKCHTIVGEHMDSCNHSMLMLLYAFLGFKSLHYDQFKTATHKVLTERDLSSKLRKWISDVSDHSQLVTPEPPVWVIQMTKDSSSLHEENKRELERVVTNERSAENQERNILHHAYSQSETNANKAMNPTGTSKRNNEDPGNYASKSKKNKTTNREQLQSNLSSSDAGRDKLQHQTALVRETYLNFLLVKHWGHLPLYNHRPTPGLQNPGNDCYLNVVVQLLYGMKSTRDFFYYGEFLTNQNLAVNSNVQSYIKKGGLILMSLHTLIRKMRASWCRSMCPLSTMDFKNAVVSHRDCNHNFSEYDNSGEHDVNQFLLLLLDHLCTILTSPDSHDISSLFYSREKTKVQCLECGTSKVTSLDVKSACIQLPIRGDNLQCCLEEYTNGHLSGFTCSHCKSAPKKGHKTVTTIRPSKILILTLKRWDEQLQKINELVRFPLTNLSFSGAGSYNLVAVINHVGAHANSGHYFISIRHGQDWIQCNDKNVSVMSEQELVSKMAYTLVYCQEDAYEELISAPEESFHFPC